MSHVIAFDEERKSSRERSSRMPIGHAREAVPYRSKTYCEALAKLQRFAQIDRVNILIEGESGTGKTRLAEYIHQLSPRAAQPLQKVVLSTLSDSLAESELFGHVAGSFTDGRRARDGLFASASRGTLFLDELGKVSLRIQQLLLHVVEYGEMKPVGSDRLVRVDTRLIAATNIPLADLEAQGVFLPDLRARMEKFVVRWPPLRERREDIPTLVTELVAQHAASCAYKLPPRIHPELMNALEMADWPGNVRELDATMLRLLIDADGEMVLTTDLCTGDLSHLRPRRKREPGSLHLPEVKAAIARAGDISKAARSLEVDRTTIHRILRREEPGRSSDR